MKNVVYVTGNANKAKYFSQLIGLEIEHKPADVDEIQSLDHLEVVKAKAFEAYNILKQPVLIEDTALTFDRMGRLPGTFIKWFLEELGPEGLCKLADQDDDRRATASCAFVYYDGKEMTLFRSQNSGTIARSPRGSSVFGWNAIFIPNGQDLTLGEMDEETFTKEYLKIKPIDQVREFLDK